ncbi:MAG: MFS transporter [Firmicutes bacterium]|nr:MFS transporter [Bacillota bacterium]
MAVVVNKKLQRRLLRRNTRFSFLDGMWFNVMMGATIPYMGVYMLRLGGTKGMVGGITSLPPFVSLLSVLLAASLVERYVPRLPLINKLNFTYRSLFLVVALIPLLPAEIRPTALLLMWGLIYIPWSMASVAWTPMMSTIVPEEERGRFFGNRNTAGGLVALVSTFIAGQVLERVPFLTAFSGVFFVSFIAVMVSQYYVMKQREPIEIIPGDPPAPISFQGRIKRVFSHREKGKLFAFYCAGILIFHFGLSFGWPLYPVRQVEELGLSNGVIGLLSTVGSAAALFGHFFGGRIIQRWGYFRLLLVTTLGSVISPLIWTFFSSPWMLAVANIFGQIFSAGYFLCQFSIVMEIAPEEHLSDYTVLNSATANLAAALGPLAGTAVVQTIGVGTSVGFVLSSAIMFLGVAMITRMLKVEKMQRMAVPAAEALSTESMVESL